MASDVMLLDTKWPLVKVHHRKKRMERERKREGGEEGRFGSL